MLTLDTVEKFTSFKKVCEEILELDPAIRFTAVITEKGKVLTDKKRNIEFLVPTKDKEMLFTEVALRVRMRQEFDKQLGPVAFSLSYRKNIVIISFPYNDKILFVSADTFIDLGKTPFKILEIIANY